MFKTGLSVTNSSILIQIQAVSDNAAVGGVVGFLHSSNVIVNNLKWLNVSLSNDYYNNVFFGGLVGDVFSDGGSSCLLNVTQT